MAGEQLGSAEDDPPPGRHGTKRDVRRNADCPWDLFDSVAYLKKNYASLLAEDELIISRMGEFFSSGPVNDRWAARGTAWRGVDVGAGTNLYPTLGMLPLADEIVLCEHSAANKSWLENSILPYSQSWDGFWEALCRAGSIYSRIRKPRALLPKVASVAKRSIFDLRESEFDLGTMFFVAESITGDRAEFEAATAKFLQSLKPGAPFVAAFMRNSTGYVVGEHRFPAVAVTEHEIRELLDRLGAQVEIEKIPPDELERADYDGMILATGFTAVPVASGSRRRAKAGSPR